MVPMWFFPIAIAAGNTVVLKPSEKVPTRRAVDGRAVEGGRAARRRVQRANGDKVAVDGLLTHPDVQSISFVGSTPIARYVYETGTAHGKRVQALGGAKNHMLVLPDADLDLAADQAINAGFGSAGERCMAISAVLAVGDIADELVAKIKERAVEPADRRRHPRLRHGPAGHLAGPRPGVGLRRRRRGGRRDPGGRRRGSRRSTPTATASSSARPCSTMSTTDMSIYTDEIFGPVLSVVRVDTYDEGVKLINDNPYGNGTAIFTNDGGAARQFQNEVKVGMIGINVPVPVPMAYYSFGGWKNSLFGDTHAHGIEGVHFFTRGKVSPPAGSIPATAASTWASRRTSDPHGGVSPWARALHRSLRISRRPAGVAPPCTAAAMITGHYGVAGVPRARPRL